VTKRLLLAIIFGLALPVLYFYGLIPHLGTVYVVLLAVCICCGIALVKPKPRLMRAGALVASCGLSLGAIDLSLRATITRELFGPPELFMYHWPPMPSLWRYAPDVAFHGVITGDLAKLVRPHYEEKRLINFTTDAFGFRNYPSEVNEKQKQYDLILLGDSFGTGADTTQDKTWASLFEHTYGLRTYNLSVPGSGPWHELMNLKVACGRLHCSSETTVLWALFSGNDLDDDYGDTLDPTLVDSRLRRIIISFKSFRNRSPIRNLVEWIRFSIHDPWAPQVIVGELPGGQKLLFRRSYIVAAQRTFEQVRQHPNYPKLLAVLDEMKNFAASKQLKVYVVVIPAKEEVYHWVLRSSMFDVATEASGFSKAVHERCRVDGFPFLDLKPFLGAEAKTEFTESRRLIWWSDDTHWNENGHQYSASVVYRFLSTAQKRQPASPPAAPPGAGSHSPRGPM
jgi:hypothetical protein